MVDDMVKPLVAVLSLSNRKSSGEAPSKPVILPAAVLIILFCALPLSLILMARCLSLYLGMREEYRAMQPDSAVA